MRYIFVIAILLLSYFSVYAQKELASYNLVKTEGYGGFNFASPKVFLKYMGMGPHHGKLPVGSTITIISNEDAVYIALYFTTNSNSPFYYRVISYEEDKANSTVYFKTVDMNEKTYHFLFNDKERHITRCPDNLKSVTRLHYE